jgi:hypothetical protein
VVWWINFSIGKLVRYADSVTADRRFRCRIWQQRTA